MIGCRCRLWGCLGFGSPDQRGSKTSSGTTTSQVSFLRRCRYCGSAGSRLQVATARTVTAMHRMPPGASNFRDRVPTTTPALSRSSHRLDCGCACNTTELVRNRCRWRGLDDLELATLEWVDWFNHHRLLHRNGRVPARRSRRPPLPSTTPRPPGQTSNRTACVKPGRSDRANTGHTKRYQQHLTRITSRQT